MFFYLTGKGKSNTRQFVLARGAATVVSLMLSWSPAYGANCDAILTDVVLSRTKLIRAANEADFGTAKEQVRLAKKSIDSASLGADSACGCQDAISWLTNASTRARHARDSNSPQELRDSLSQAIRMLNLAIEELGACSRR